MPIFPAANLRVYLGAAYCGRAATIRKANCPHIFTHPPMFGENSGIADFRASPELGRHGDIVICVSDVGRGRTMREDCLAGIPATGSRDDHHPRLAASSTALRRPPSLAEEPAKHQHSKWTSHQGQVTVAVDETALWPALARAPIDPVSLVKTLRHVTAGNGRSRGIAGLCNHAKNACAGVSSFVPPSSMQQAGINSA